VAEAPAGAPEVPPAPTVITVTAPGVVEIVEVFDTTVLVTVCEVPVTRTSPAPPPAPRLPNPPPPPPPTTATSIVETPDGVVQLQVVTVENVRVVNPPEEVLDGEQELYEAEIEKVAVAVPEVFVAVIV
jgi:hypothetical protein